MSICAACGADNRAGRKFCARCGTALGLTCSACGTANQPDELFCGECGAALAPPAPSSQETVAVSGEKKQITVLFADVAGSMDLQERLDAEVWAAIMGRFVSVLAEGVRKFGGTVDKFTGDGIMALFGAPVAQEDHARRACHAAWHLTKSIGEYSEELRRDHGIDLQVRLGLNSGEVVVGRVGEEVTLDPTALGHTVGLAQRMEAMAEPGKAYLTESTARLAEGWFRLDHLGSFPVKGARDPLAISVLGRPTSSASRPRVGASLLVGRDRELAVLEDALSMAMEGHAQVVGVVGEAGVGKSRLCEEFAQSCRARDITVRRTGGVSHGRDVPLLPILALYREHLGITDVDDPAVARRKVTERLLDLDPGLDEALPLVFDFLQISDPDRPPPLMAPEARTRRVFDVVRRVTARRSERETLVLLFEDLHWFDPQSEAFLERMIDSYPGSRTLVITNFRPEFSAQWMRHSYYRQLPLSPLRDQAVTELVRGLLGMEAPAASFVAFISERTAGNPFFVEEVIRALIEDGTLAGTPGNRRLTRPLMEIRVPPSVQAVLAARIDRLPREPKTVLEIASVIGRTFDTAVLAEVSGWTMESLDNALSALCAAELLQEAKREPNVEYRFWHPLTQDVAYSSLLAGRRQDLHAAVAEALIAANPQRLDELAAVLAWHWDRAGRPLEAGRWNLRAGNWALRTDLGEAQRRWRAAIDVLNTVDESDESLGVGVRARIRLIQFGARTGLSPDEIERLFLEGRALSERLGDPLLLAMTVFFTGSAMLFRGDFHGALDRYLEGVRLAEEAGDQALRAGLGLGVGGIRLHTGELSDGLAWVERTLTVFAAEIRSAEVAFGYNVLARLHQMRAWLFTRMGRLSEVRPALEQALELVTDSGDPETLSWTLAVFPELEWLTGENTDTQRYATEAVRIAEETANEASLALAVNGMALALLAAHRPQEAAATCQRMLNEMDERSSARFAEATLFTSLACARFDSGDTRAAAEAAGQAVGISRRQRARVVECLALLSRGRIQRTTEPPAALDDLNLALILARKTGALTYEPLIREELARLQHDDHELREALRLYREIGATGHARRLEAELSAGSVRAEREARHGR